MCKLYLNSRLKMSVLKHPLYCKTSRVHILIVVHVCPINFFYVFIVPGPILRHLGEFGKIRLLPGENTRFLPEEGQYGYLEDGL